MRDVENIKESKTKPFIPVGKSSDRKIALEEKVDLKNATSKRKDSIEEKHSE
jgi:hypothetical protein